MAVIVRPNARSRARVVRARTTRGTNTNSTTATEAAVPASANAGLASNGISSPLRGPGANSLCQKPARDALFQAAFQVAATGNTSLRYVAYDSQPSRPSVTSVISSSEAALAATARQSRRARKYSTRNAGNSLIAAAAPSSPPASSGRPARSAVQTPTINSSRIRFNWPCNICWYSGSQIENSSTAGNADQTDKRIPRLRTTSQTLAARAASETRFQMRKAVG